MSKNYIFLYEEDYLQGNYDLNKRRIQKRKREILCFDLMNNLIAEYSYIREAEKKTGVAHTHISACAMGKQHTAGGYIWRYKYQY